VKIVNLSILAAVLFLPNLGSAKELALSSLKADWDFVAPSIYDTANLPAAASGLIVYDSKTDSFYAKGPMGSGDWRSFSQGTNYGGNIDLGICTDAAPKEVNWAQGSSFTVTLTSGDECEFAFQNRMAGQTITIWVTNGAGAGDGTVTWPTAKWQGGNVPVMTVGAGKLDVCTFTYNGTAMAGSCIQDME
jgi:hypothetical protein